VLPFPLPVIVSSHIRFFLKYGHFCCSLSLTDLQDTAALVSLSAAGQHVGFTTTGCQPSMFVDFNCVSFNVTLAAVILEYKVLDRLFE